MSGGSSVGPDPFWPEGAEPKHLKKGSAVANEFEGLVGPIWKCEKCGTIVAPSPTDKRYCVKCAELESQNSAMAKRMNSDWMEQSTALGLSIFERQPEETDTEWRIWCAYRSYYPRKLPTWTELAAEVGCSASTVVKTAQRWSYKVRLIAWSKFTDDDIQEKRIAAIREMNEKQLGMAKGIQEKLATAIELLDPTTLRPGEIVNLFKVATELERRVTTYVEEKVDSSTSETQKKQTIQTKPEDMASIVAILQGAGVLEGKVVGVEQTTRLIAKEYE